jgi:hypothetical protein
MPCAGVDLLVGLGGLRIRSVSKLSHWLAAGICGAGAVGDRLVSVGLLREGS